MINTILFDFDGVLVDSEPLHYSAEKRLVKEFDGNLEKFDDANKKTLGLSIEDVIAFYKNFFNLHASIPELMKRHDDILKELIGSSLKLVDGIPCLLELLNSHAYDYAIASSGSTQYVTEILKILKIYQLFKDKIFCVDMVSRGKPDPAIFLYAVSKLNVPKKNCLIIEDSLNGIIAANSANIKSLYLCDDDSIDIKNYNTLKISSISEIDLKLLHSL
ncbi:MAG: HAD family phosphatase [Lachnospiraceae bacterium]|jgi:beta-phosphoglucomutase-like phosphatase (HAD superfamily)|nr:HAD family phosphatase [Lachnospiraceae bacterium]MCI9356316.1 HAD family phosphatase [Lachnospiraceae bacterium]